MRGRTGNKHRPEAGKCALGRLAGLLVFHIRQKLLPGLGMVHEIEGQSLPVIS